MNLSDDVCQLLGADSARQLESVQSLWSGYGEIVRFIVEGYEQPTVIVKWIQPAAAGSEHPRGWNGELGHRRKVLSYQIEAHWYQTWQKRTTSLCRTPRCLGYRADKNSALLILEDLNPAGYSARLNTLTPEHIKTCLIWLAQFHGQFIAEQPSGLWPVGSYWHLDTRPEEFMAMAEGDLKRLAHRLDKSLNSANYQTIIHGDAKLANFCFSKTGNKVAAVDFQYVGGGVGVKDLAYFLSSVFTAKECQQNEAWVLDYYFEQLKLALKTTKNSIDASLLEAEWRALYPVAWADFCRFLLGWSPGHKKLNAYSLSKVEQAVKLI